MSDLSLKIIEACLERQIRVLAFDFDLTILDIHTQGQWQGPADELLDHIQPWAKCLMRAVLEHSQVILAVATFSSQPAMIRNLLRKLYPKSKAKIDKIAVCANTGFHLLPYFALATSDASVGKNIHLKQVLEHVLAHDGLSLTNANLLLLDDDPANIQAAVRHGFHGCIVTENFVLEKLLDHIKRLP